jgi:hypothetical protein
LNVIGTPELPLLPNFDATVEVAALPLIEAEEVMKPAPFVNWLVLFGMLIDFAALPLKDPLE